MLFCWVVVEFVCAPGRSPVGVVLGCSLLAIRNRFVDAALAFNGFEIGFSDGFAESCPSVGGFDDWDAECAGRGVAGVGCVGGDGAATSIADEWRLGLVKIRYGSHAPGTVVLLRFQ